MFGFLKKKLKGAISRFSKTVDEEAEEKKQEQAEEIKEEKIEETMPVKEKEEHKEEYKEEKGHIEEEKKEEKKKIADVGEKTEEKQETAEKIKEVEEKKPEQTKEIKEETKEETKPVEEKEEKEDKEEKEKQQKETKKEKTEEAIEEKQRDETKETEQKNKEDEKQSSKKGFFSKIKSAITTTTISEEKFESLFWNLEVILLENNVAVEVIEKIKQDLKQSIVSEKIKRGEIEKRIIESLKNSINSLFTESFDLIEKIKNREDKKRPYVMLFMGVNGSGKTTTIAKIAYYLKKNNISSVIAAADTFRAAAIHQIEEHANNINVKLIKHGYNSDPAAVAFDAIKYAESKNIDAVLIDTAGRLHSNINLMKEMEKISRVSKPDLKVFIGEAVTGNDCVEQAKKFDEAIGIDAIVLTKVDVDEHGGAAISISYVTKKPIIMIGLGQGYGDLKKFDKSIIISNIGL